ncbi:MAG: sulfite exporter TauE/SafE family protein, partial [Spirochaetia bacterium]|nr:sulfite exporter TauE/SafE family protein [Spirochaetia bacterium]
GAAALTVMGEVAWYWLPALIAGSLLGGFTGAHLALRYGNIWIKRIYEAVTLTVGMKLIVG